MAVKSLFFTIGKIWEGVLDLFLCGITKVNRTGNPLFRHNGNMHGDNLMYAIIPSRVRKYTTFCG